MLLLQRKQKKFSSFTSWHNKFALAEGADPNSQDKQGRSPLHFATLSKSDKCAAALLAAGAQCNLADVDGRNPVHWAAYRCCPKLLKLMLLNSRESVSIQDKEGTNHLVHVVGW